MNKISSGNLSDFAVIRYSLPTLRSNADEKQLTCDLLAFMASETTFTLLFQPPVDLHLKHIIYIVSMYF